MKSRYFKLHILCVILGLIFLSCKKEGCTDSMALNYNPKAKSKPELCIYETKDSIMDSFENFPTLISGNLNFVDDNLIVAYQGVTDHINSNGTIIPDVFGWGSPSGFSFIISTAQFEDEERQIKFVFFVQSEFETPLYGNYEVSKDNQYIGYSAYVMGKTNDNVDFNATFPVLNYINYYKDLNNPITNMEGNISINYREPESDEKYTDFSGSLEATLYYDEEIVLNQNNQEVRIYHKKLIININEINGKIEID